MFNEIKSILRNDTVFYTLVILGVAIASFGLGRVSVTEKQPLPEILPLTANAVDSLRVTSTPEELLQGDSAASVTSNQAETQLVASKSGTKYHYSWCPGAKQIKDANRITFATTQAARAAGYTPAANCPGLE